MSQPLPIWVVAEPVDHLWSRPFDEHPEEAIALADLRAARQAAGGGRHRAGLARLQHLMHRR